jgi:putative ABC transport system substrate-binding protein
LIFTDASSGWCNDTGWLMRVLFLLIFFLGTIVHAAPQQGREYSLLILDSQLGNPYDEVRRALLAQLAEYDYVAGKNLKVEVRAAGNDIREGEAILDSLSTENWNVIFSGGTVATIAAKNRLFGSDQPVVFGSPTDPVGIGVIDSFEAQPKANFTGVCYPVPVEARMRFVRQLMPEAKTFGLIYADMPQSHSYNRWLRELVENHPDFQDINIIFRSVPLVTGEYGDTKMAQLAIPLIQALNQQVDAFIKPNDQMGTRMQISNVFEAYATRPLIGLVKNDVVEKWGATAVVYPSHESIGKQTATMIRDIFEGKPVAQIKPQWPRMYGYGVDLAKTREFGIKVPIGILQLSGKNTVK